MNQKFSVLCIGMLILIAQLGIAAGKAPSQTVTPVTSSRTPNGGQSGLANPSKPATVHPVGTKPFNLPNGAQMDLSADLDAMFGTALNSNSSLSPAFGSVDGICDARIEVRAAVTTLELDLTEVGIKIGYHPGGSYSTSTGLSGEVKVKVGTIAMDFAVFKCQQGACNQIVSSHADHATTGTAASFGIDLGQIKIGPNLIHNTALGGIIRQIMEKGVRDLAADPRFSVLHWQANVISVSPSDGSAIIDVGVRDRLAPNQILGIYTVVNPTNGSACKSYTAFAYARTIQVDMVSTTIQVEQVLSSKPIEVGDIVMVKSQFEK